MDDAQNPSPSPSSEGDPKGKKLDRVIKTIDVAQSIATAIELYAEASQNEALTWIARASRGLLSLAATWLRAHRR